MSKRMAIFLVAAMAVVVCGCAQHKDSTTDTAKPATPDAKVTEEISWWLERAGEATSAIKDPQTKAAFLYRSADYEMNLGNKDAAAKAAAEIDTTAHSIQDAQSKDMALFFLTVTQARADMFAEALKTTEEINDPLSRQAAKFAIVWALIEADKYDKAMETANAIKPESDKMPVLLLLAHGEAGSGKKDEAAKLLAEILPAAMEMKETVNGLNARTVVARVRVHLGQYAEALATVEKIEKASEKSFVYCWLAEAQAKAGLLEAIGNAKKIEDEGLDGLDRNLKAQTLRIVARLLDKAGKHDDAVKALTEAAAIFKDSKKPGALAEIAAGQAEIGLIKEALATAESIGKGMGKSYALEYVVKAQAKVGLYAEATETANKIDVADGDDALTNKILALDAVAKAQAKAGHKDEAAKIFKEVLEMAKGAGPAASEDLAIISVAQATCGMIPEAVNTAKMITDQGQRQMAFAGVARYGTDAGMEKALKKELDNLKEEDPLIRSLYCGGVAERLLIKHGLMKEEPQGDEE